RAQDRDRAPGGQAQAEPEPPPRRPAPRRGAAARLGRRARARRRALDGRRDRQLAMTRRLYHDDAYLRRFDAEVTEVTAWRGRPAVVLDRTAFYPEAGGQLGDRGTLGGVAVADTQETDDGRIVHVLELGAGGA